MEDSWYSPEELNNEVMKSRETKVQVKKRIIERKKKTTSEYTENGEGFFAVEVTVGSSFF